MTHPASLSHAECLALLDRKECELQSHRAELQSQRERLREQNIALQTKELQITQLTRERDEYKLAFDKLLQQRFRKRSERYLDNPDQLRFDFGDDDTSVTLLYPKVLPEFDLEDPKQRRMHEVFHKALKENQPSINGKMWAYRGMDVKLNVFDFTVSRHRDGPEWFLADYRGTLLGDCWHGFESIAVASEGQIVRAACNAHARRKLQDSTAYPADRRRWLLWYQQLYDIEDRGRELSADEQRDSQRPGRMAVCEGRVGSVVIGEHRLRVVTSLELGGISSCRGSHVSHGGAPGAFGSSHRAALPATEGEVLICWLPGRAPGGRLWAQPAPHPSRPPAAHTSHGAAVRLRFSINLATAFFHSN